ncbi:hypothetical protein M446_1225 [Methylobacterium sp. 4-46]|uniref:hypothetical protein n=1 Tax=unclassified Methylobacterium TaxID=2615210 RepID=UPI000165C94A|nr:MULTISPECIES: hypothetical protein [Methylobacterium]ACA15750.1 hypothetical protein M446_1225 [Methylobacterium sp. 4-46]WFT81483.1 hypothetical protein QA634_06230 [Methylobacterium nodulans]
MSAPHLIIESVTTRDCVVEHSDGSWVTLPRPPRGVGWVIADSSRERHTTWRRIRLAPCTSLNALQRGIP